MAQATFRKRWIRWRKGIELGPGGERGSPLMPPQFQNLPSCAEALTGLDSRGPRQSGQEVVCLLGIPQLCSTALDAQGAPRAAHPSEVVTSAQGQLGCWISGCWILMPEPPQPVPAVPQLEGAARARHWSRRSVDDTSTHPRSTEHQ